ncbi:hypothetical protein EM595_1533 [Duffyella gerundensis]|uniref:Uncharacterized protein n=1 Tax=Duffyella gerundensis TaxID=1619313 RepID=A0A0U5L5L3_9GAMM|nr:hypothetical protein EM595_1533 [Duffyella gerundensis]
MVFAVFARRADDHKPVTFRENAHTSQGSCPTIGR